MKNHGNTKKSIIVSKNKFGGGGPSSGRKTQGRKYKVVDSRLKKDLKAQKRIQKLNHGRGPKSKVKARKNAGSSVKRYKRKK